MSSVTKPWWPTEPSSVAIDVLDLVGQQRRRIDVAGRRRPEQQRDLAPVADRLVGERPDAGHPEAAGDEQQVPRSRVDLERPPERPEHVDRVAGPEAGEPLRPAPDRPEMDRDRCRSTGSAVLIENGRRRTSPDRSPVRTWTNWPARSRLASSGAWNDWSHWPGRISRLSTSSVRTSRIVTGGRRPPRPASPVAFGVVGVRRRVRVVVVVIVVLVRVAGSSAASPAASKAAISGAIDGNASASASARSPNTSVGS